MPKHAKEESKMKPTKEVILMKQIIVAIALTVLGMAIATLVFSLKTPAETVTNKVIQEINDIDTTL